MASDWRNIVTGRMIPTETYSDQPYIVKTDDGAWLCVLTTGSGREGEQGQHIVTMRSSDRGRTWSAPIDVEPAEGPEASYAALLRVPSGRIYCFYNHNSDNIRQVIADDPPYEGGICRRVDSLGHFCFKHSDDHGRSWSRRRYDVAIREMAIDRGNACGGKIRFFWNVGRPFIAHGAAYVSVHKVGGFGHGFFTRSEGVLVRSENILLEDDPTRITWQTLPDGEYGLRTPTGGGPIAEEHSYSLLSDGSIYCVYRTIDGHPAFSYSRDAGHTWSAPQYKRYTDGRLVKHPRAANFCWRCKNGNYLYWFHNHGGTWYEDRNPVWLCGGVEVDSPEGKLIRWSQPEIVLYDDDPFVRMSYPDLVEEDGQYYLTETQKDVARVHLIDRSLIEGLWRQFEVADVTREGLALECIGGLAGIPEVVEAPQLPPFVERDTQRADHGTGDLRAGFTLDTWVLFDALAAGQVLLDSRHNRRMDGKGFCLLTAARGAVEIALNDGRNESRWCSDPGMLGIGSPQHIVAIVDGGPKIVSFIINGVLCDGGEFRQFGWGRFSPNLRDVNGDATLCVGQTLRGRMLGLRIYHRYLRVSEAIANWRADLDRVSSSRSSARNSDSSG